MNRLAFALWIVGAAACHRPLPSNQLPAPPDREVAATDAREADADADGAGAAVTPSTEAEAGTLAISPRAAAIIDSIETAVRDSFAALARDSLAAAVRRDSIAAAREIARQDSVAAAVEAAREDSIAAAVEATRQDSIARAEIARQDSIVAAAEGARRDSIAAAEIETARQDSIATARATVPTDLEQLKALGPSFIPYDEGPGTIWNTDTQAALSLALLPVLREQALPARTHTTFWVLVTREGDVEELVIQTTSGNDAFDAAAQSFAERLTFIPAMRVNRPVPTWVLREISILMR